MNEFAEKEELFKKLLDLIQEFDRVCTKYGIQWFAAGGTALGAVRHKGFIPWDDDIDIYLLRAEYEKLKSVSHEFRMPYFFQNPSTDPGYPKCFSRLRNSDTTEIPFDDAAMKCNLGIFIDIFPLDVLPNSIVLQKFQQKRLKLIRMMLNSYSRYYAGVGTIGTTKLKSTFYYFFSLLFILKILTPSRLFSRFEKICKEYEDCNSQYIGDLACSFGLRKTVFNREWVTGGTILLPFEDMEIPVSLYYDEMLTHQYGDYMKPVRAPSDHGNLMFSATVPYHEFVIEHKKELLEGWRVRTEVGRLKQE